MRIALAVAALALLAGACSTTPEEQAEHDQMMAERCAQLRMEIEDAEDDVSKAYARNNYENTCLGKREQRLPDDRNPARN